MKISCLVADDEPLAVQLLEDYIRQVDFLTLAYKCSNAMEALAWLKQHRADLLFLDINMPRLTGLQLAALLPQGQHIVFTTAYSEHAVQSYEYHAVDYLLKPVTFERFVKAANRACTLLAAAPQAADTAETVFVKSGRALIKLVLADVVCIEGLKDYVTIHTTGEKIVAYKRMKELAAELPAGFLRIHNSYIVNMQHISRWQDNHVQAGDIRIPVSEKYREAFLAAIGDRML